MFDLSALEIKAFNNLIAAEFPTPRVRLFCQGLQHRMVNYLNNNTTKNGCVFGLDMAFDKERASFISKWSGTTGLSPELTLYLAAYDLLRVQNTHHMYPEITLCEEIKNIKIDAVKRDGSICFAW
jgi:hypothetical protein